MVNENRIEGAARNFGGKVQDAVGGLTGDSETQARGKVNQLAGTAQNSFGSVLDEAGDWVDSAMENTRANPLTALLVAGAVGYLLRVLTSRRR